MAGYWFETLNSLRPGDTVVGIDQGWYCFRQWLGAELAPYHYLQKWGPIEFTTYRHMESKQNLSIYISVLTLHFYMLSPHESLPRCVSLSVFLSPFAVFAAHQWTVQCGRTHYSATNTIPNEISLYIYILFRHGDAKTRLPDGIKSLIVFWFKAVELNSTINVKGIKSNPMCLKLIVINSIFSFISRFICNNQLNDEMCIHIFFYYLQISPKLIYCYNCCETFIRISLIWHIIWCWTSLKLSMWRHQKAFKMS